MEGITTRGAYFNDSLAFSVVYADSPSRIAEISFFLND